MNNYKTALEDYEQNVCSYCKGNCDKGIQISTNNNNEIHCYCGEYEKDIIKMKDVTKYVDPIITKRFENYILKKKGEKL